MDALRAMREARYEETLARAKAAPGAAAPKVAAKAAPRTAPKAATKAAEPPANPAVDGLCGHRSMNGRTCTREQGHAAKSHRYS